MNGLPTSKTAEERRIERFARREYFLKTRPLTENRGWQMTNSGGINVWQLVEGGEYRIFRERKLESLPLELELK